MNWLTGQAGDVWMVAAKAALIYVVAVIALRVAQRRTLSQWTAIDFAASVAVGAIVGRTALASNQSFLYGVVALVTLLVCHSIAMFGRYNRALAKLVDHRVRVIVENGELRRRQMRICGLTENDVEARLRQLGVRDLADVKYVLYETKGELTIVREGEGGPLVAHGLRDAAGYPGSRAS